MMVAHNFERHVAASAESDFPLQLSLELALLLGVDERPARAALLERVDAGDRPALVRLLDAAPRQRALLVRVRLSLRGGDVVHALLDLRRAGDDTGIELAAVLPSADAPLPDAAQRLRRRAQRLAADDAVLWEFDCAAASYAFLPDPAAALNYSWPMARLDAAAFAALLHPDDVGRERDARQRHLECDAPYVVDCRLRDGNGAYRWFRLSGRCSCNAPATPVYFAGTLRDIDASKRAANELAERQARIEQLSRELRGMSERLVQAQENEARRIARELHDQTGQTLTAAVLDLEYWRDKGVPPEEVGGILAHVKQALGEVRDISRQLHPPMLAEAGLENALRSYLERQAASGRFDVSFAMEGEQRRLSPPLESTAFRLVQAAVTNIMRHAGARHVDVSLRVGSAELLLRVSDNGSGCVAQEALTSATSGVSLGLISMQERAALVGGRCEFISTPAVGSIVLARLPLA